MSFNYNHITLVGRLTRDPQQNTVGTTTKTVFSLAIDRPYRKNDGSTETDFVPCVLWGKLAEIATKYLHKGSPALVEGRLQIREYEQEGVKKWASEVVADNFQILEAKKDG